jgi:hypothetical protein
MTSGFGPSPDPYVLRAFGASDNFAGISWKDTNGLSRRSSAINPALKTLVLISSGQSPWANVCPTLYLPVNAGVIDQMNIYDGELYSIGGPLLGSSYVAALGPGNITARLADLLVTNGKFDRVIVVATAIGSTTASMWGDPTGDLYNRLEVAMARLASRGIVPGMPGVTFACIWGLGENDDAIGTSQAAFMASAGSFLSKLQGTGFKGRIFIPQESWIGGATSSVIQAAQAALVNGKNVFSGGNLDTLTAASRQADNTHWNDAGAASAATLVCNALHASGSPY